MVHTVKVCLEVQRAEGLHSALLLRGPCHPPPLREVFSCPCSSALVKESCMGFWLKAEGMAAFLVEHVAEIFI